MGNLATEMAQLLKALAVEAFSSLAAVGALDGREETL